MSKERSFIEVHDFVRNHSEGTLTTVVTDRGSDAIIEKYGGFLGEA